MTETASAAPPARTTVFVAVADQAVRDRAIAIVEAAADVDLAGWALAGPDAVDQICAVAPDLALIDVALPDLGGAEVCGVVSERFPVVRLLLLAEADDDRSYAGVAAGAVGCLLVDTLDTDLLTALRRVAWGEGVVTSGWAARMMAEVAALADQPDPTGVSAPDLTPTEREVLRRIAAGATPESVAQLHQVPTRLVQLHARFAVGKLYRMHRDRREVASLR